jgi:hypothetical protein
LGYILDVKNSAQQPNRMTYEGKKVTPVRCIIPPQVKKDFAGVRGRVQRAVAASPRSVALSDAVKQIQLFNRVASKR